VLQVTFLKSHNMPFIWPIRLDLRDSISCKASPDIEITCHKCDHSLTLHAPILKTGVAARVKQRDLLDHVVCLTPPLLSSIERSLIHIYLMMLCCIIFSIVSTIIKCNISTNCSGMYFVLRLSILQRANSIQWSDFNLTFEYPHIRCTSTYRAAVGDVILVVCFSILAVAVSPCRHAAGPVPVSVPDGPDMSSMVVGLCSDDFNCQLQLKPSVIDTNGEHKLYIKRMFILCKEIS